MFIKIPTAKVTSTYDAGLILTQLRKSVCLRKSSKPFENSVTPKDTTSQLPPSKYPPPSHDLMAASVTSDIQSVELDDSSSESSELVRDLVHTSVESTPDNHSKKALYQKWTSAVARDSQLRATFTLVKK